MDRGWFLQIFNSAWIFCSGREIPPITALPTLYTVKNGKFSKLVYFKRFYISKQFLLWNMFRVLLKKYIVPVSRSFFYCRNLIRDYIVTIWEEKKLKLCIVTFVHDFHISVIMRDIWIISTGMGPCPWDMRLMDMKHFLNSGLL